MRRVYSQHTRDKRDRVAQQRAEAAHVEPGDPLAAAAERGHAAAAHYKEPIRYTSEELRFLQAMDRYKRKYARPFPGCNEVLAVLKSLGYHL